MRNIIIRNRVLAGADIVKIKQEYIKAKLSDINYETTKIVNGEKKISKIEFCDIRKDIEPPFTKLIAELDFCYYIFWQYGESMPFQKWDVQETKEASFALFTKLSNSIYDQMAIALYDENEKRDNPYPKLKAKNEMLIDNLKAKTIDDIRIEL